jgi:hypothetical protein
VAGPVAADAKAPRTKPAHLMCRNRLWGVLGAAASAYLGYLAYLRVRDADFLWSHDLWSLLTYSVWIALVLGLISETRCWREWSFFALVLLTLTTGFWFSLWDVRLKYAREAREVLVVVWVLAAVASLTTLAHPAGMKKNDGLRN